VSTEIRIPKLGMSMQTATLQEWLVDNGAQVEAGQMIYAVETDKSVTEIEAPASGTLTIIGKTEEEYPVGELIGTID
jgi:pyruvate/2-oxoglutarate dehydrogenase complex dihydrolipoamide acyltransferase (E2) component